MSALAWASKEGYEDIVVKLIDKGAFLNVPDNVSTNQRENKKFRFEKTLTANKHQRFFLFELKFSSLKLLYLNLHLQRDFL